MLLRSLLALILGITWASAQDLSISGEKIRPHVKYLSSDALEGRGVGTRGGDLATDYIATQLRLSGVKPAGDADTYFQKVTLVGATTLPDATLTVIGKNGGSTPLAPTIEFVGNSQAQKEANDFEAEAVFVGHGISAPEFGWDDYKGADVRGKVLVFFTNEPPSTDPKFFGGRALTYYGRWTYKYEEAFRRGAIAAIIIHTTPTAGYGWEVVRGSHSRERPQMKLERDEKALSFAGWVTEQAGSKIIASTGKSVDQLLTLANQKDFRPIPLDLKIAGHIPTKIRTIESRNVVGKVEGTDPMIAPEAVLFTAHWDHLGVGLPVNGDGIYNGAVDNATGCAMVLEIARVWASLPQKPERSALFVFVTAEESGLLGSEYYGKHPVVLARRTAAALNFDGFFPLGKTQDVSVDGAERTTLWPLVQSDAARLKLEITPDAQPEQGHYYRSDHFSLARVGIPSFSISAGSKYYGKSPEYGQKIFKEYNDQHYHQPSDEYRDDWNFAGMEQMAQFGFVLGLDIANQPKLPTWNKGDEFLSAREKSGVK